MAEASEADDAAGECSLGCPECEAASFTLMAITGHQEDAEFAQNSDGSRYLTQAGSVHVAEYDPDQLRCDGCGAVVVQADLVEVGL